MQRQSCAQTLNEIHVVAVWQVDIDQCQTKRMVLNQLLGAGDSSGAVNVVVGNAEYCLILPPSAFASSDRPQRA